MDSVWMKIVLKNSQNSLPGHPHHQIFQSRHQILACWSWDWTSLATASYILGNALLLEKKVGPNGWVPAHLDHCACLGLVRRLAHRHTDDAVCSIASHNNELPMLRISIDPHWCNWGVEVNKFESTPVFSSNSGLNLASSYLQQGADARTATSIGPTIEKKLELQSSLRIIYHDQLILNCTFSRNPLRSGNPAQFTESWDRIFGEVSFRTK